jgi:hypothetical protein
MTYLGVGVQRTCDASLRNGRCGYEPSGWKGGRVVRKGF